MEAVDWVDLVQRHVASCCGYGNELWGPYIVGNLLSTLQGLCCLEFVLLLVNIDMSLHGKLN